MRKDIEQFLRAAEESHFDFLRRDEGFPNNCVLSSHVLASYLVKVFRNENIELIYGTYGPNRLYHVWLRLDDKLIDFTRFQFLAYKEKRRYYLRMTPEQMREYVYEIQGDVIQPLRMEEEMGYHPLVRVNPYFTAIDVNEGFLRFWQLVFETKHQCPTSWMDSILSDGHGTFGDWIKDTHHRVTRRYFSKWAIVPETV